MTDQASKQAKDVERQGLHSSNERSGRRNRPARPEPSIHMDELRELIALIRENGFAEFELENEGFRVRVRRETERSGSEPVLAGPGLPEVSSDETPRAVTVSPRASAKGNTTSSAAVPLHPGAMAETAASADQDLHIIPSPIVGTFYRSPSPNAESFVKIGTHVEPDTVVCIIEAMKLMNEIQAEASGEIAKIYVENGQPVEYGQPLFGIKR
jgi:acetyl-CoA carboxylase biotin carboxyl carrier protein